MPLYEYECTKCHKRTEKIESASGPHLKKCPHCGGKVERLLAAPAIQFKGSGWYVTDYAAKKGGGGDGAPSSPTSEASSKDSPKESAKEASAKETKEKKASKK